MDLRDLTTPALLVEADAFERNLSTMSAALPGSKLRPHVKAHKSTALAARQAMAGHTGFTAATVREIEGLAAAGLGDDLLLANEVVGAAARRLGAIEDARVTVCVDSEATVEAAAAGGVKEVLIDVALIPRCGVEPHEAGRLAEFARSKGLSVRGVMGYEGHVVLQPDRQVRVSAVEESMQTLLRAHEDVGGDVVSAGGTGTYDINTWATEIQAGSYILMDTEYAKLDLPFRQAVYVLATVISVSSGWAVLDTGLKSLGMDHGPPALEDDHAVVFVADEHLTFVPSSPVKVGDRLRVIPAHVDPTVAYHERMRVVAGDEVVDTWEVDLRGW